MCQISIFLAVSSQKLQQKCGKPNPTCHVENAECIMSCRLVFDTYFVMLHNHTFNYWEFES